MAVVTTKISLDVNSDPAFGAENLNATGSRFTINLEIPVTIPNDAFNATVRVEEATVWNTVANISAGLGNNKIYLTDGGVTDVITIPDGSYNLSSLSTAINREYAAAPFNGTLNLFSLEADEPTQKVVLVVDGTLAVAPGAQVDFTPLDTFRDVLGFNSQLSPVAPTLALFTQLGDNDAAFNNIEYFKIHSDIGDGIRSNRSYDQTIARVNITSAPGSQIVHAPQNPAESEAARWVGASRNNMSFWLTDQLNNLADTGEIWSVRLVLQYDTIFSRKRKREGEQ